MDHRQWQWRNLLEKRTYQFCLLFYLCLLLQQHMSAAETGYNQESKSDISDSKLDSLSSYLPYDSREDSDYKRGSAFIPLRGKKPSDDSILGRHIFLHGLEDLQAKRSQFFPLRGKKIPDDLKRASYFMPMRGRKDDGWMDEDYDITDENPYKRASSFMPMRGKKRFEAISDYLTKAGTYSNDVSEALNPSSSSSYQRYDKRMHSFVPVRGKRSFKESDIPNLQVSLTNDSLDNKVFNHTTMKRSSSFMPMRGRKFDNANQGQGQAINNFLAKKLYSFMPMRGRRDSYEESNNLDKKAAAFMPMRGRRDSYEASNNLDKKAAAFMPMRGRRYNENRNFESSQFDTDSKRAQSFMPMRGRRTLLRDVVYESSSLPMTESRLIEDKRASSFMPMRGRRSLSEHEIPSDSSLKKRASMFTPMRGRRSTDYVEKENTQEDSDTYKKRSAFMPMRGRRLMEGDMVQPWPADQLMNHLDKKSSAFMPMRGRRFDYENVTVDPWPADELMSLFNKRSSAFMPMRGRKSEYNNITVDPWPADELMSLFNKKSAFMPMRGKKTNWNLSNEDDLTLNESEEKRSSSFMPMRGRRFDGDEANFYNPYPYLMAGIGSSLMSKPYNDKEVSYYSGKSANERRKKFKINWDAVKRAFHATRGKRFHDVGDFIHSLKDNNTLGPIVAHEMESDSVDDSEKHSRTKRSPARSRAAMRPNRQYIGISSLTKYIYTIR